MSVIENRLGELGLQLPAPPTAPPDVRLPFELVRVHGDLAYVSGHRPFDGDKQELGDLDRVTPGSRRWASSSARRDST
jgi:hypothetical protein